MGWSLRTYQYILRDSEYQVFLENVVVQEILAIDYEPVLANDVGQYVFQYQLKELD